MQVGGNPALGAIRNRRSKDVSQKYIMIYCIKGGSEIKCNHERALAGFGCIKTSLDVTCDDIQSCDSGVLRSETMLMVSKWYIKKVFE